jgi:hypothetical protein
MVTSIRSTWSNHSLMGTSTALVLASFLVFEFLLALTELFLPRRDIALGLFESGAVGSELLLGNTDVIEFSLEVDFLFGLGTVVGGCATLA